MVGLDQIPLGARVANAFAAYAGYLRQAVWPTDLAVLYPHPVEPPLAAALLGAALVVAATAGGVLAWRRQPALLVGWLWFAGMLVPTLGLVQVGAQAMADRYTYLPLTGLAIALAWGAPALLAAAGLSERARRRALAAAGCACIAALAVASRAQLDHWRNSEALFRHTLAVTRENPIAHAHLGDALLARGLAVEAAAQWEQALRLLPDDLQVSNNLAWLRATSPDAAVADAARALALAERALVLASDPRRTRDPLRERAAVLDTLAAAQARAGRGAEAQRTAGEAVALAERAGDAPLAAEIGARLSLYAAGRPYLER
jgi:tetratricopeptide (TPR) repeat protein